MPQHPHAHILKMPGTEPDVNTPSLDYAAMEKKRKLPRALVGGTRAMRAGKEMWTPKLKGERDTTSGASHGSGNQYEQRLEHFFLVDFYDSSVTDLVDRMFSQGVILSDDTPQEILDMCHAANLGIGFAVELIKNYATNSDAAQLIAAEKERETAETARQEEIRALCTKVGHDDLAPELISGGMSAEHARKHLAKIVAKLDRVEIDTSLTPDNDGVKRSAISPQVVYAARAVESK